MKHLLSCLFAAGALAGTQQGTKTQPVEVKRVTTAPARLVAGTALAKDKAPPLSTKQSENMMGNVKGTFDMTKQPRPYIVFLILDQSGNRYPSFWCGRNLAGNIKFDGRHDLLDDKVVVDQAGGFVVQLTNAARKTGMYDRLPGGEWAEKVRDVNLRVSFEKFTGVTFKGTRKDGGDRSIGGNFIQFEPILPAR